MNDEAMETQGFAPAEQASESGAPSETGANWPTGGAEWQRVSPSYAWADLALNLLVMLAVAAGLVAVLIFGGDHVPPPPYIALSVVIVVLLINALLAFRRVRAIGYVLREDDLLFRRGILFERVIAVPYGRLQLVDVTRGPLLRALGLATLKFVTASVATGVQLPGLRLEEAERLRDRLVELAEARRSGL
ncbi:PH domain-containing protein [Leucobacter sp. wl10]|uniref:PH domain-containing protein n=1 Tax=Leucobacter sp. wl10 TaxID=2304677 RepID=UPI001F096B29|nr:PH domain-containing protein [Leucobacter sp. wl10]